MKLVLTCEHAGNLIPETYKSLFEDGAEILESHRGYDPGALDLYNSLKGLADFKKNHKYSRLLIEVNRSLHHQALFSEFTGNLPVDKRKEIIKNYYLPYRTQVINSIGGLIEKGEKVIHLSIHSFTPQLNGEIRNVDIGLLYDPSRKEEKNFCEAFKHKLQESDESLKLRFNYPYRGIADGFTTALRKIYPKHYVGVEIEVNQKFSISNKMAPEIKEYVLSSVKALLQK